MPDAAGAPEPTSTVAAGDVVSESAAPSRPDPAAAGETIGCEKCLSTGGTWVHLRRCDTCGHVGCCDSSAGRHATRHFHDTGHPVMSSAEPGKSWRWSYVRAAYV